ncbi:DNA-directed RNA polymerase subunit delta [Saccharibacillus sp. CPCC 101409]|uniref:DNA-directed RNA polymerase subunit delta n=1 Tax=Saccharibacillus sp. CPCC 101409 TaxID=3058041 RepID=UPI0026737F62|nr:DNA-directed RNA polymerase subunit delta [Saccharibacillus sp. CPCC 101409]MDO3413143.1 DNA-directed RNA polymerase subunit delta [Saccharibacillus sp. CPCC 101409]
MPMVDLAFLILKKANEPYYYPDLMKEVARHRGLTEKESADMIAQLYTEINIDGRFACVGTNLWGLKRWYPLEKSEDPVVSAKRPRIINDEDDDDLDDETTYIADSDEESFDDTSDEDEDDELYDGDEEEVDEDVIVDDEIEEDEEIEGEQIDEEDLDEEEEEEEDEDYEEEEEK